MPNEEDREFWIRVPEIALRLATIEAAYRGRLADIDLEGLKWAIALAEASIDILRDGLDKYAIEDLTREDLVDRLREVMGRKVSLEMTIGECHQACKRHSGGDPRKVDDAIAHLLRIKEWELIPPPEVAGRGAPTLRYRRISRRKRGN
jgi:hypothetical protein